MYLGYHAARTPDKPAIIIAETGETLTYKQVNDNSLKVARFLDAKGLTRGDTIAILMENHINYMDIVWAALRSGFYVVTLNRYATAEETAYILQDCEAKALFASDAMRDLAAQMTAHCEQRIIVGGALDGWLPYEDLLASHPADPIEGACAGATMPYTSGTTGRPKGVVRPISGVSVEEEWNFMPTMREAFAYTSSDVVHYSPAPMYHGGPMLFLRATHSVGGTIVQTRKFDAERALADIERFKVTHSFMVPTMFVRMLKMEAEARRKYDCSSLVSVVHSAAPCPVEVKQAMIDWWGPVVDEFYGATDGGALIPIKSVDWQKKPGAAGIAAPGLIAICDEETGAELPAGTPGLIYFICPPGTAPHYKNDPAKTAAAHHPDTYDWMTSGDVGYVDEDGYLFLTDRKAYMIISGGVNIYPQMVEDALIVHDEVADAAVFGIPNPEMGEEVKAVVELLPSSQPSAKLAAELIDYVAGRVSKYMVPKTLDFVEQMPRTASGKLLKKQMRDAYWEKG